MVKKFLISVLTVIAAILMLAAPAMAEETGTEQPEKAYESSGTGSELPETENRQVKASALEAPKNVSTANDESGVRISWSAVSGAQRYRVYRKEAGGKYVSLGTTAAVTCIDKKAVSGTVYEYKIKGYIKSGGKITYGAASAASMIYRLGVPKMKSTKNTSNGIGISWYSVAGADSYGIYRKKTGGSWTFLGTVRGTAYTDTAAKRNVNYLYTVKAYGTYGDSTYEGVYAETGIAGAWLYSTKITSIANRAAGLRIRWAKADGADGYILYRKIYGTSVWSELTQIDSGDVLEYVDSTAEDGKYYSYCIKARKGEMSSVKSPNKSRKRLSSPEVLQASKVSGSRGYLVSWKPDQAAQKYRLYRRAEGSEKWILVAETDTTAYQDSKPLHDKVYYYTVRAYNSTGNGARDEEGFATKGPEIEDAGLTPGKSYFIMPASNTYTAVDVQGGSFTAGVNVRLYSFNGTTAQQFIFQEQEDGYYYIRNAKSWNVLDIEHGINADGSNVHQYYAEDLQAQKWKLILTGDSDGSCYIVNKIGRYLTLDGSASSGTNVIIWSKDAKRAQKFVFEEGGESSGIDLSEDGTQSIGMRQYLVEGGNLTQTTDYYDIKTSIVFDQSGGYYVNKRNIGIKVIYVNNYLYEHEYLTDSYYHNCARFTDKTLEAVKKFQEDEGLEADGTVGLITWRAMGYSDSDFYNLGTYRTPIKVNRYASSKADYVDAMLETAAEYAAAGTDYRVGCSGKPGTWVDCSGLIFQCLYSAGINPDMNIIDHAYAVHEYTCRDLAADDELGYVVSYGSLDDIQRGDLVFYENGAGQNYHVAIYAGDGYVYDSWPGLGVTKRGVNEPSGNAVGGHICLVKRIF